MLGKATLSIVTFALMLLFAEGFFRVIRFDFEDPARGLAEIPIYYRSPALRHGDAYYRRDGPQIWKGRVIHQMLSWAGHDDLARLYEDAPSITASYDRDGFRNPEGLSDWEVVVVGDSFVELGYLDQADLFTTGLAEQLGIRVRNLGVAETGPLTYIAYLKSFGKAESTTHAVLVFYEGNDLTELAVEVERLRRVRKGEPLPENRLSIHTPQNSLIVAISRLASGGGGERMARRVNAFYEAPGGQRLPMTFYAAPPGWGEVAIPLRRALARALHGWAKTASAAGMQPWLLYMPSKLRILYDRVEFVGSEAPILGRWRPNELPAALELRAKDAGIRFIDATPALRSEMLAGRLPYNTAYDSHLNRLGSRLVAEVLAEALAPALGVQRGRYAPAAGPGGDSSAARR